MTSKFVYIVGAGFSKGLGYPDSAELFPQLWDRLDTNQKETLGRIVQFHYPAFEPLEHKGFPNIEKLLTAIAVNEELFSSSRRGDGNFTLADLREARKLVLLTIEKWFHGIHKERHTVPDWLDNFKKKVVRQHAAVVSFNWDLELDHLLFGSQLSAAGYGFEPSTRSPVLLKPHGSLNWYDASTLEASVSVKLFRDSKTKKEYHAFLNFVRGPISKLGRTYAPCVVPPTYLKKFDQPIYREVWNACTERFSTASEIIFLGYSMPDEDRHTQFIMHCGLHNQMEGIPLPDGTRTKPPAHKAKITVVNPDDNAFARIKDVVGPKFECLWVRDTVANWCRTV
jgi:hypothetical protein